MVSLGKFTWSVFAASLLLTSTALVSPLAWAQQVSNGDQYSDDGSLAGDGDLNRDSDLSTPADIQFSTSINGEEEEALDDFAAEEDVLTADRSQQPRTLEVSDTSGNQRERASGPVGLIQPDGSVSPIANQRVGLVQGGGGQRDNSP